MSGRTLRLIVSLAFFSMSAVAPLQTQIVTGQVVDSISGSPVGFGFVVLLDSDGGEVARTLSDGTGSFRLASPGPGSFRLRSERIGYNAFTSLPFALEDGQVFEHTLRVLAQAIILAAVEVEGEDRCRANPDEAEETGVVWQEIRKALAATAWDSTQELARYRLHGYRRAVDLSRQEVLSENGFLVEGYAGQPYRSVAVERLIDEGFIVDDSDSVTYNLPDAAVLQDDRFLAAHCFHVVRDSIDKPGQIGLAFEPLSRRGPPDVRGALWLDEATSELRVLDVKFTELPHDIEDDRVGGTVEFLMLPSGAWIVSRWQVRTPAIRVVTGGIREIGDRDRRIGITGFSDTGGDVLEITTRDGVKVFPAGLAHISGVVYDSTRAAPLSGATVSIDATPFWGSTDDDGVFYFTAPLEGAYGVELSHPSLDSIGLPTPRQELALSPGAIDTVIFDVPHANTVAKGLCPDYASTEETSTILGSVRRGSSGRPAEGLSVTAAWYQLVTERGRDTPRKIERSVTTDGTGSYVLCGIPLGVPVTVRVPGARIANVLFPQRVGGFLQFARAREPGRPYSRSFRTNRRTWRIDLLLTGTPAVEPADAGRSYLSGYVTDASTGRPVGGVTISVNGVVSTETRMDGTFDLLDVEWHPGSNSVVASRGAVEVWKRDVWLDAGQTYLELGIQLP